MARALGVNTSRIYSLTFALGAALAGLTGALYAPTMTRCRRWARQFIVQAFVSVVVSGADVYARAWRRPPRFWPSSSR